MSTLTKVVIVLAIFGVIVFVVLPITLSGLFALGVFNSGPGPTVACITPPGYLCQQLLLNTSDQLSFDLGWTGAGNLYDVKLACMASGVPSGPEWQPISDSGAVEGASYAGTPLTLASGAIVEIRGLQCYGSNGQAFAGQLGQTFAGTLWINYTIGANSTAYTGHLGTLTVRVT